MVEWKGVDPVSGVAWENSCGSLCVTSPSRLVLKQRRCCQSGCGERAGKMLPPRGAEARRWSVDVARAGWQRSGCGEGGSSCVLQGPVGGSVRGNQERRGGTAGGPHGCARATRASVAVSSVRNSGGRGGVRSPDDGRRVRPRRGGRHCLRDSAGRSRRLRTGQRRVRWSGGSLMKRHREWSRQSGRMERWEVCGRWACLRWPK